MGVSELSLTQPTAAQPGLPVASRYSLGGTIGAAFATAPRALVSPKALAAVGAVARQLPAALTDWIYLECRLSAEDPQVDMIVKVDEAGRAIIAGENAALRLAHPLEQHPVWRRIQALCREWGDSRSGLSGAIDHLWLEFDIDLRAPRADVSPPGVYVCFGEAPPPDFSPAAWCDRALAVLPFLLDRAPSRPEREALTRCIMGLGDGAYAPYIGVMYGRPTPAVRLCVTRLAPQAMAAYLRAVGWSGDPTALEGALRIAASHRRGCATPDATMLHLDVSDCVGPTIGVEYTFERQPQLSGHVAETDFLAFLSAAGLCTPRKAAALRTWPGTARATLPHELWPSRLVRLVNHVKIVHRADGGRFAKGYVCAWHPYLPRPSRPPDRERMTWT